MQLFQITEHYLRNRNVWIVKCGTNNLTKNASRIVWERMRFRTVDNTIIMDRRRNKPSRQKRKILSRKEMGILRMNANSEAWYRCKTAQLCNRTVSIAVKRETNYVSITGYEMRT